MTTTVSPSAMPDSAAENRVQGARAALERAREHTLAIIAPLTDADVSAQHDSLMSPILWDLGHIAAFEELWLLENLAGEIRFSEMPGTYNPFEHP
ncbi:MAG: DinB family protein, partial [bacterium]